VRNFRSIIGKNVELDLYDMKGNLIKSVFHGKVDLSTIIWNPDNYVTDFQPGVYFLQLTIESSETEIVKIIKM
jgi:hypothetical protein